MMNGGQLDLLIFKIFKPAAADRAAGMIAHASCVLFGHQLNPIICQPQKSVLYEIDFQA